MTKVWYGIRQYNRHKKAFYRDFRMNSWTIEEELNPNNFASKRRAEEESKNWINGCEIVKFDIDILISNISEK